MLSAAIVAAVKFEVRASHVAGWGTGPRSSHITGSGPVTFTELATGPVQSDWGSESQNRFWSGRLVRSTAGPVHWQSDWGGGSPRLTWVG